MAYRLGRKFAEVDTRFKEIDKRFENINKRFEEIDKGLDELKEYIDIRVSRLDEAFRSYQEFLSSILLLRVY